MKVTRIQKEIRDREDLIFQSYQELDKLYPQGIIGLLKKFGVNENETYVFDKHKAKNRGLDDDAYGIAYTSYNEIRYYWETDDDVFPINCTPGDVMVQENIKKLYNYLDIETRIPKNKRIVRKISNKEDAEIEIVQQS